MFCLIFSSILDSWITSLLLTQVFLRLVTPQCWGFLENIQTVFFLNYWLLWLPLCHLFFWYLSGLLRFSMIFFFFFVGGGWVFVFFFLFGWCVLRHIFFRKTCIIFRDFEEKLAWFYQCFPKIWSGTSVKANVKQLKDLLFVSYNFCIKHLHQEVTYKILKRLVSRGMFITHSNILRSSFFVKLFTIFTKTPS